jgi:arylsulfatase A-like enzyme
MRRRAVIAGVALALAATSAVLLYLRRRPEGAAPARIVLVSIDTLRADHLGCYGYDRETSPVLDALAAQGVLFEDVTSPSPWTLPAHASLLTGLYPSRHGLKSHEVYLPSSVPTLASLLSRHGFVTAAVVNSHNLGPRFGLDRGFQEFLYVEEVAGQREPSTRVTDQALSWLQRYAGRKLFLFVHYYDVHSDYCSRPEYEQPFRRPYAGRADGTTAQLMDHREGKVALDERDAPHLVDLYDAGIRQMDAELSRLLAALPAGNPTWLAVTSDHGEEFFERGGVLHGRTQFQEVARVPLLVRGPGVPARTRVAAPVSLLDVMPTLLAASAVPLPESIDGADLAPHWRAGEERPRDRHLFGEADHNNQEHDVTRAVRHGRHKLLFNRLTRETALFDLVSDPGERTDLDDKEPAVVAELRAHLDRFLQIRPEATSPVTLTPEERERLRSLGYVR